MGAILEAAYDNACAVFTRPFTFCEWKVYAVPSSDPAKWAPFGVSKDKTTAYRDITHDVWIYVFRKFEGLESTLPVWVEELFQAKDGTISAAPMAEQLAQLSSNPKVEPKKRPEVKAIGKTTTFPRRINGRRTFHYVFASRVRLPLAFVNSLMTGRVDGKVVKNMTIDQWAPAFTFEEYDINLLEKDGKLMVAVLDPVTIALHLHTYAEASAQDCMEYGGDLTDKAAGRQCKVMLARILQSLLEADKDLYQEVHSDDGDDKKTWDPYAVDKFLDEYREQIAYRQRWKIRWHTFLVNWLDSAPFQIAFGAYKTMLPVEGLLLICRLLNRISDSEIGRGLLLRIACSVIKEIRNDGGKTGDGNTSKEEDPKWDWVAQHIFATESEPKLVWEIIEKAGANTIAALKEWAPFVSTGAIPPKYIVQAINARIVVRLGLRPGTETISVGRAKLSGPQFWKNKRGTEFVMYQIKDKEKGELGEAEKSKVKPNWAFGLAWAEMVLQVVTAAFVAKEISEAFGPEGNNEKKALAIIAGVHSVAKLGAAVKELQAGYKEYAVKLAGEESHEAMEAIEHYEIAAGRLAAIAALADYVIGVVETVKSLQEGETGEAIGHAISTVGFGLEFIGGVAAALSIPGLGEVIMIGAALVMIGNSIVKIFKKTDYQHFVRHCFWGTEYGEPGPEREWAVKPFEEWKDHYDVQLKSLIQLLCQFELEGDRWLGVHRTGLPSDVDKIRTVNVKMGWVPVGVRIEATYEEQWNASGSMTLKGSWEVKDQPDVHGNIVEGDKDNTLQIKLKGGEVELSPLGQSPRSDLVHKYSGGFNRWNKDFVHIEVGLRLILALGTEEITIPYEENTFKKASIVHNDNAGYEN